MQIYQPYIDSHDRVIWNGGDSTQLHFQFDDGHFGETEWIDEHTRTLMEFPTSMSDLHTAMVDLYNYCSAGLHNF
jgi:hypothetical protein